MTPITITSNSPSQDCNHPDDLFQSRNNCYSLLLDWVIIFMSKYEGKLLLVNVKHLN